ncbi:hypothetical protein [Oceanobacter mangrovi]|uniref:hypothetical protein n=1 Tax=Oceanobacter mangrovi TaxID=2862510 RepID=UPI001C8EF88D|nr:hypothetical protein [Oceanobacter mangrovi]
MSEILQFPVDRQQRSDLEVTIDAALQQVPKPSREKIRFELVRTIDSYDAFFTEWDLQIPAGSSESFKKQIYDVAHQEHERKMRMLKDIMKYKIQVLVAEYQKQH